MTVYTALDREFAAPILEAYAQRAAVRVLPKFDVESTKTVGLTNLIIAEAVRPRCDLFWNNEILNTVRLKDKGLLVPFRPAHADALPDTFKAKDGTWYGFAAWARVLLVNTRQVPEAARARPPRPARPRMAGEDGHRQAALRHDGHARRLPVRRLGTGTGEAAARFWDEAARFLADTFAGD